MPDRYARTYTMILMDDRQLYVVDQFMVDLGANNDDNFVLDVVGQRAQELAIKLRRMVSVAQPVASEDCLRRPG